MRKVYALLLSLALVLSLFAPAMAETAKLPLEGTLVILHTNDIHGRAVGSKTSGIMGYAEAAQYKKDAEALGASVLLLDAGDGTQGLPIVNLSQGATAIEFMNAAGYDAMSPGNHEFDWGTDNALQLAQKATFPWLAANITRASDGTLLFEANRVFEMSNGMKVGVFGLTTAETATKSSPDKNTVFADKEEMFAVAQKQVEELQAAGSNLIVCLAHLGVDEESIGRRSTDLIAAVPGIDVVIDGHSHSLIDAEQVATSVEEKTTLLAQTGSYFANLGAILYDGETLSAGMLAATSVESSVKQLVALVPSHEDAEVAAVVNGINDEITAQLAAVFAKTEVDLNGERAPGVRTEETNLGDFATDAMLWAARKLVGDKAVAAINNGGGIRASIPAGDISMNDMKTVFPYGNTVVTLDLTGAELLEALEAACFNAPEAVGAFPQVSGIVFTVDTSVPYEQGEQYPDSTYYAPAKPGSRVTIDTVGGEPYDAEKVYTIVTNNFSAAGGDTYYVFAYAYAQTGYNTDINLEDALVEYVQTQLDGVIGEQYAAPQGRITIK